MFGGSFSAIIIAMLLTSTLTLAFNIQLVKAEVGTVYIRADGSIDPPTASISSVDNVTYTFTDNINDSIIVERDNIVVDGAGYTLEGTGAVDSKGISLNGRSNVTIKNMKIEIFEYGIRLENSPNNDISANNITNNADGILLFSSSGCSISGNNITNNWHGILLFSSSGNSISENTFINGGLYVWDSYPNSVGNNTVNGRPLVYLEGVSNCTAADAGQVILVRCDNIRVEGLNLSRTSVGVELWETSNSRVSGNNITDNKYGILLYPSSNNTISGNNITANNWGGIWLDSPSNCTISGNNITNNPYGIRLSSSSSYNSIYHNNFVDNTQQVYIDGSENYQNVWDNGYPSGGNYWSDYTGVDLYSGPYQNETGSDGMGDEPYIIDGNNRDNYPLMRSYVPFENQTIYIRAGGSVDPSGAPMQREGDVYALLDNITSISDGIVIERDNIIVDGVGYTVEGTGTGLGFQVGGRTNVTIKNVKVEMREYGINLGGSTHCSIIGSNITSNGWGISLYPHGHYNSIVGNNMTANGCGIWGGEEHCSSNHNMISENNIAGSNPGIYLAGSWNNSIIGNNITGIGQAGGISLDWCSTFNILGNNVTHCHTGMRLYKSSNCSIVGNDIARNDAGIVTQLSENVIYHNNFLNNTNEVVVSDSANVWDDGYPSGGNYWSDYTGIDQKSGSNQNETGSDGMGDAPYVIDADNQDSYPLMKAFPWNQHDTAVTMVSVSKTVCGQGYETRVNAMVFNYGGNTETLNVTAYANETIPIEMVSLELAGRTSVTVNFTWNTTGFAFGNYSISAFASPVEGETYLTDNTLVDGWVYVSIPGDINGDQYVNAKDAVLLGSAFYPAGMHNPNADINNDGYCNAKDAVVLGTYFGQHW